MTPHDSTWFNWAYFSFNDPTSHSDKSRHEMMYRKCRNDAKVRKMIDLKGAKSQAYGVHRCSDAMICHDVSDAVRSCSVLGCLGSGARHHRCTHCPFAPLLGQSARATHQHPQARLQKNWWNLWVLYHLKAFRVLAGFAVDIGSEKKHQETQEPSTPWSLPRGTLSLIWDWWWLVHRCCLTLIWLSGYVWVNVFVLRLWHNVMTCRGAMQAGHHIDCLWYAEPRCSRWLESIRTHCFAILHCFAVFLRLTHTHTHTHTHPHTLFQLMECAQECWISTICANAPPSDLSNDLVSAYQMLRLQARSLPSRLWFSPSPVACLHWSWCVRMHHYASRLNLFDNSVHVNIC